MSKHSRKSPPLANNVEGATGHVDITNMWYDHFNGLLNCIDNITHRKYVLDQARATFYGRGPHQYFDSMPGATRPESFTSVIITCYSMKN